MAAQSLSHTEGSAAGALKPQWRRVSVCVRVCGVTGSNDDKCSAGGLTQQLPSRPSASGGAMVQSVSIFNAIEHLKIHFVWCFVCLLQGYTLTTSSKVD